MSELGNQLKSQTLNQVVSTTFNTVGGRVFPDLRSNQGLADFIGVVQAWRATHAQAYGNANPNTGIGYSASPTSTDTPIDVVAATDNEVVMINAISTTNAGGAAPVPFQLKLGDTLLLSGAATPSETEAVSLQYPIYISKGQTLTITATSGTASDLTCNASAVKSCQ
jgi:hypothetical protein